MLGAKSWEGGHALASLEHSWQEAVTVAQRHFTSTAAPVDDLLQPQDRFSTFVNLGQDLAKSPKDFERRFGVPARTLEGWEQGRKIDAARRVFLTVIEGAPEAVEAALSESLP